MQYAYRLHKIHMNEKPFYHSIIREKLEEPDLRYGLKYLYMMIGLFVILAGANASAGSFTAQMDVDTYVDSNNASESFSDAKTLWAASENGNPNKIIYLSFINLFGSEGIYKSDAISSATLTLEATNVEKPGKIVAYLLHGATLETATWNDREDYDSGVSAFVEVDKEGSYKLDATSLIKEAVETCTEGCPYSLVLVAEDGASVGFASSENSGQGPSLEYATGE
jgi:hypothetical protein